MRLHGETIAKLVTRVYRTLDMLSDSGHVIFVSVREGSEPPSVERSASSNRAIGPEALKAKVRATALKLFASQGYHATPVSQIAEAAGVAKGTFFKAYAAKADVLGDLLLEIDASLAVLISRLQPSHPQRSLEMLSHQAAKVLESYVGLAPALAVEMARRPHLARLGLRRSPHDPSGFHTFAAGLPDGTINTQYDAGAVGQLLAELWAMALMDWMRNPAGGFDKRFYPTCKLFYNVLLREMHRGDIGATAWP